MGFGAWGLELRALRCDLAAVRLPARLIVGWLCFGFVIAAAAAEENAETVALRRASYFVLQARKASDLDPLLIDLRRLAGAPVRFNSGDANRQSAVNVLNDAARFLQQWQNYLWAVEGEKFGDAIRILSELGLSEQNPLGVPRSEILARARLLEGKDREKTNNDTRAILQNIRSLEDVPAALAQLKLEMTQPYRPQAQSQLPLINALDALSKAYLAFKQGVATTLPPAYWQTGDTPIVTQLRAELLLRVLPRVLGVEQTGGPKAGETVEGYLMRMRSAALDRHDFDLLVRIILAARDISSSSGGSGQSLIGQDYISFVSLREAQNAERAKRFLEATLAYRRALSAAATTAVPVEFIGERLRAIEKEHPGEYKQAIEVIQRYGNQNIAPSGSAVPGGLVIPAISPSPAPLQTASPAARPTP